MKASVLADKWPRPTTVADARTQARVTLAANDWDADEIAVYLRALGIQKGSLDECEHGELKVVLADLEKARMIIY